MRPFSLKTWRDPHTPGRCWFDVCKKKAEEEQKEKEEEYLGAEN